jgi:hypothetical protein
MGATSKGLLVAICAIWAFMQLHALLGMQEPPRGYETEGVARSLADGHGFSLPNDHRWLTDPGPGYGATAWVDPIYAGVLGGAFVLLGEKAQSVMVVTNIAAGVGCLVLLFFVVRSIAGPVTALLGVGLLVFQPWFGTVALGLNNSTWGAFLITLVALLTLRAMEKPSVHLAAALGLCMGVAALTCSSTLVFLPVVPLVILAGAGAAFAMQARAAVVTLVVACAVITPWTLRNAAALDEFIPVRTGAGQLAHVGVVMLAATVEPASTQLAVPPEWRASGPRDAVRQAAGTDGRNALERAQRSSFDRSPPAGYASMNEAQRDKTQLQIARDYALGNPVLSAQLGVYKLEQFARRLGRLGLWTLLAAVLAGVFLLRDRRVLAISVLVAAFALPFAIFIAYFHRYRIPIEPLVAALACIGGARLAEWAAALVRRTNGATFGIPGSTVSRRTP